MRIAQLAVLAALAVAAVAGCGTDEQAATGGAELVPKSAPAFVAIDSDADSAQWQQVEDLISKFPDGERAADMAKESFSEDTKLDWERDVKPALGDEVDVVWLDFAADGENVVALTKPDDKDAFRRMVAKGNASDDSGDDLVYDELDDWFVVSDSRAKIRRFKQASEGAENLADDQDYKDAVAQLPDARLVTVYARGDDVVRALGRETALPGVGLFGQTKPEQLSASLSAEGGGFKFVGASEGSEDVPAESYTSKLIEDAPADAVAFLSFRGGKALQTQLPKLEGEPSFQEGLRELEQELGIRLDRLLELFENEVALYVRPGTPLPEVTLLLEAPNEQEALAAVDDVLQSATSKTPAQPCGGDQAGVKCIDFGVVSVRYAALGGKIVVTTGRRVEQAGGLADSQAFKDATDGAGMPDKNAGFVWIDVKKAAPMLLGLAEADSTSEVPPEVSRNLEPLQALVAWATADGTKSTSELFVEID